MESDGESWGMRRKATDKMTESSAAVQMVAESGEARRRELDHVGSGVEKYGETMSHTLNTYHRVSYILSDSTLDSA
jgi:hypothetical protein